MAEEKNKSDDGGPAFPTITEQLMPDGFAGVECSGMSLRDWFATHAPAAPQWWLELECGKDQHRARKDDRVVHRGPLELEAAWRFAFAAAMLAVRGQS